MEVCVGRRTGTTLGFLSLVFLLWHGIEAGADLPPPRVWLYSLVATDYDGHRLLEHFLDHYRELGVLDQQMHFDLLHDPQEPDYGLEVCIFFCLSNIKYAEKTRIKAHFFTCNQKKSHVRLGTNV